MGHRKKKAGGVSYVDPPSDEEVEIEVHAMAASSSGRVPHHYTEYHTKIPPPRDPPHESPAPEVAQTLPTAPTFPESIDDVKKRYQVRCSSSQIHLHFILYLRAPQS